MSSRSPPSSSHPPRAEDKPVEAAAEKPIAATATVERPLNIVNINVPANIFGAYSVEYQRVIGKRLSVFAEPTFFNLPPIEGFNVGIVGPGVVVGAMIYPFHEAPDGFFVAPEAYLTVIDSLGDDEGFQVGGGLGAIGGWQWRFWDHLVVSAGLGATANAFGNNLSGGEGFGFLPLMRANVGYAF